MRLLLFLRDQSMKCIQRLCSEEVSALPFSLRFPGLSNWTIQLVRQHVRGLFALGKLLGQGYCCHFFAWARPCLGDATQLQEAQWRRPPEEANQRVRAWVKIKAIVVIFMEAFECPGTLRTARWMGEDDPTAVEKKIWFMSICVGGAIHVSSLPLLKFSLLWRCCWPWMLRHSADEICLASWGLIPAWDSSCAHLHLQAELYGEKCWKRLLLKKVLLKRSWCKKAVAVKRCGCARC